MKGVPIVDRRFFLRAAAVTLTAAPAFLRRAWADSGHEHGEKAEKERAVHPEETANGHGEGEPSREHHAEEALHGHGAEEQGHGREEAGHAQEEPAPAHGHGKEEAAHGHEREEAARGHGEETQGYGEGGDGHQGHGHGKENFKKYGLVRAEKGFKEYNLKLSQYRFTPDTLRVDVGDRVRLNLDSVDATHGFYIDGYGLKIMIPEKVNKTVEFVADSPGAFRIRCASTCGPFHPFMIGRLVVGQSNLFWWGLAATVLLPAAMLVALGRKEENTRES